MQPGKKNEYETRSSLRLLEKKFGDNFYWFRINDTQAYIKSNPDIVLEKSPSDFVMIYKGKIFFLEDKSSKNPKRYAFRYVADHQIESLTKIENAGGYGIFMFTNRSEPRNYKRYSVKASEYKKLRDLYIEKGKKSCLWEDFEEIGIEIPRIKGSKWNLEVLLNI